MGDLGTARASPTKDFFVRMLTRDIELKDALLDLLDNCVDGIIRTGVREGDKPYAGYHAKIVIDPDRFAIEDNCGGIPIDVARRYAFAMGRPPEVQSANGQATVGMYGIGMKRAIFKLGGNGVVESNNDVGFRVEFTREWMTDDRWQDLPIHDLENEQVCGGTRIEVTQLHGEAAAAFKDDAWVEEFKKAVERHYALIIQKGFLVQVGRAAQVNAGEGEISPEPFKLLYADASGSGVIEPYFFVGELDGVEVEVYAGLYRKLLTEDEMAQEEETRGSADDAGWTVACNDRVVIWKDKSRLTGWGEANVPNYHGQFIPITGIVLLRSEDPKRLPLTTTKRGVDAASNIYSEVKDLMREATKGLTSFTNKWKKFPANLERIYRDAEYMDLKALREVAPNKASVSSRRIPGIKKSAPSYPEPPREKTDARVSFTVPRPELKVVQDYLFGGQQKVKPGQVGEAAFQKTLAMARLGKA